MTDDQPPAPPGEPGLAGSGPAGDGPAGDRSAGDESAGDGSAGSAPAGDGPAESAPAGGGSGGSGPAGSGTAASGAGELRVTRGIGRVLAAVIARVTVVGAVPAAGPVLLAANHTALVDGPMLYGLLPRPVAFLVKEEAFRGPLGTLLRHTRQIPVRRGLAERAPLLAALGTLAAGGAVGVFPEGTRGDGQVSRVHNGIAYLALRSGAPVVPVAVHGTAARRGWRFCRPHRPPVLVVIGPPLSLPGARTSRRTVASAAEEIHRVLAAHVAATRPGPEDTQR